MDIQVLILAAFPLMIVLFAVLLARRDRRTCGLDSHTGAWFEPPTPALKRRELLPYLAYYVLYALLLALSVAVFFVWPPTILALIAAFTEISFWSHFAYVVSWVLLALLLAVFDIAAQPYLWKAIERQQLVRKFAYLSAGLGAVGGLGLLLRELAYAAMRRGAA